MTTERWTDEMVDQLAASIRELRQSDQETRDLVNSNARVIQALANTTAEAQEEREAAARERQAMLESIRQAQQEIQEIKTDIRGLQIENQRMLDLIFAYIRRNDDQGNE